MRWISMVIVVPTAFYMVATIAVCSSWMCISAYDEYYAHQHA